MGSKTSTWKFVVDSRGLADGMRLTRSETRAAVRVLKEVETPLEKFERKTDELGGLLRKGAIGFGQYSAAAEKMAAEFKHVEAELNGTAEAEREREKVMQRGAAITQQVETSTEKYTRKLAELDKLLDQTAISESTYNRAVGELHKTLPRVADEESKRAQALQRASSLVAGTITAEERYEQTQRDLAVALQAGSITQEQHRRAMEKAGASLPAAVAATERREKAERELQQQLQRGAAITRQNETATERYGREVQELNQLLRAGAIDQRTYGRAAARLENDLTNASRGMSGFQSEVLSQIPVANRFAGAAGGIGPAWIGAGAAVAGVVATFRIAGQVVDSVSAAIMRQMEEVDKLAKTSSKLGMLPDTLQSIRLAGSELAGMEFNTVDMAMQRMPRRAGEAAVGTGEAQGALKALGLDAKLLAAADPGKAFSMIAEKMALVDDPAERLRLSFKLFDSEGVAMVNVLQEGGGVVDEYREKLEQLGMATPLEDAMRVEAANDAMAQASMAVDGLTRTLAVDLAPALTVVANEFTRFASGVESFTGGSLGTQLSHHAGALIDIKNTMVGIAKLKAFDMSGAQQALDGLSFTNAKRMAGEAEMLQGQQAAKAFAREKKLNELRESGASPNAVLTQQALTASMSKAQQQLAALATPEEQRAKRLEELGQWLKSGAINQDEFNQLSDTSAQMAREYTAELDRQIRTFGLTAEAAKRLQLVEAGATPQQLQDFDDRTAKLAGLKAEQKEHEAAQKAERDAATERERSASRISDINAEMERQIATVGMSQEQLKLFELKELGTSDAQLAAFAEQQEKLAALRDDLEEPIDVGGLKLDSMQAGSAAAAALINETLRESRFGSEELATGTKIPAEPVMPPTTVDEHLDAFSQTFGGVTPDDAAGMLNDPLYGMSMGGDPDPNRRQLGAQAVGAVPRQEPPKPIAPVAEKPTPAKTEGEKTGEIQMLELTRLIAEHTEKMMEHLASIGVSDL